MSEVITGMPYRRVTTISQLKPRSLVTKTLQLKLTPGLHIYFGKVWFLFGVYRDSLVLQ